jgi:hypothetical protein
MKSLIEVMDEKQRIFIKSRRGMGKEYTEKILKFLLSKRDKNPEGWVRSRDIRDRKICYEPTLFRLLKDLEEENIIHREEKNRNEVYYRIPPSSPNTAFYTYEELYYDTIQKLDKLTGKSLEFEFDLKDAIDVLKENGIFWKYEERLKEKREEGARELKKIRERKN